MHTKRPETAGEKNCWLRGLHRNGHFGRDPLDLRKLGQGWSEGRSQRWRAGVVSRAMAHRHGHHRHGHRHQRQEASRAHQVVSRGDDAVGVRPADRRSPDLVADSNQVTAHRAPAWMPGFDDTFGVHGRRVAAGLAGAALLWLRSGLLNDGSIVPAKTGVRGMHSGLRTPAPPIPRGSPETPLNPRVSPQRQGVTPAYPSIKPGHGGHLKSRRAFFSAAGRLLRC